MTPFNFAYAIGQTVRILPLKLEGRITQRCDRGAGVHDYEVVWWAESSRHVGWLLPHEIEATP